METPTRSDIVQQLGKFADAETLDAASFGAWVETLEMPMDAQARDPAIRGIVGRATRLWGRFKNGDIQRSELQAAVRNLAAENKPVAAGSGHSTSPGSTTAPGREAPITSE